MLQSSRTDYTLTILVPYSTTTPLLQHSKQNPIRIYRNSSVPPTAHCSVFQRSTESTVGLQNPMIPAQAYCSDQDQTRFHLETTYPTDSHQNRTIPQPSVTGLGLQPTQLPFFIPSNCKSRKHDT